VILHSSLSILAITIPHADSLTFATPNMKITLILLTSVASSVAQDNLENKPTTTKPASAIGPFFTTATLADGVVTVIEMPYSDGFYTATELAVSTAPWSYSTTATLADGVVTVIPMPYSDGFYTTTESAVFTAPTPATLSTNSTKTSSKISSTTSRAPGEEYTGAAAPLRAGGLLNGGAAAALGAAAYLL
jgi:hypothetical protein